MQDKEEFCQLQVIPSAWIEGNREHLRYLGGEYAAATTFSGRRRVLGVTTIHMLKILQELGLTDSGENGPSEMIGHLIQMFSDLGKGMLHPLAEPVRIGGTAIEIEAERDLRLWAITAVALLRDAGVKAGEANRLVADALSKAGRRGRQHASSSGSAGTKTFPPGTVNRWFNALKNSKRDQERVADAKAAFHQAHQSDSRNSRELAHAFVADESGLLRSKLLAAPFRSGGFG